MLVLLGPSFEGTNSAYTKLSQITGLVAYDLRTKIKPGTWGVLRALADPGKAQWLVERLAAAGFETAMVDAAVAEDAARRIVPVQGMELGSEQLTLRVAGEGMPIPYEALLTIVQGEVRVGTPGRAASSSSSATFRAVVPDAADLQVPSSSSYDAFLAADLHFATVLWVARIDARHFDFSALPQVSGSALDDLSALLDQLGTRAKARVDRGVRISNLASFAERPARHGSSGAGNSLLPRAPGDPRFDGYSRLLAQAEREQRGIRL